MRRALLALLLCACASSPPPRPDIDPAQVYAVMTHVLADACTKRTSDDFLIAHTDFLLKACHGTVPHCLRKVCVRLDEEDGDSDGSSPVTP